MITKQEILVLKNQIDEIQKQLNTLEKSKSKICSELLQKVLSCPEVLNEAQWTILSNSFCLASNVNKHKMLSDFLQTDYHCSFQIDGTHLFFDDDDVSLVFSNVGSLTTFLKTYNVLIDTSSTEENIRDIRNNIQNEQQRLEELEQNLAKTKAMNKENALPATTCNT